MEFEMKIQTKKQRDYFWNRLSTSKKAVLIVFFLLVIVPLCINGLIRFCNWVFQITDWNISAFGLGNSEWLTFWGSYFGGIATVLAVWWTVSQTERHYLQTTQEQKRQNELIKKEHDNQQQLEVLPLLLLQPIGTKQTSWATLMFGDLEEKKEKNRIYVDQLKPVYEEFDISEITTVFSPEYEIRPSGLTDEEIHLVKNKGHENITTGQTKTLIKPNITFINPFWLINIGKELAINILISLTSSTKPNLPQLSTVFSLMSKARVKINFLVNVKNGDEENIFGDYILVIHYHDIYSNHYKQEFPISIQAHENGPKWTLGLDIDQSLVR